MKLNRKTVLGGVAAVMSAAMLSACGGSASSTAPASSAPAESTAASEAAPAEEDIEPLELMAGCTYNTTSASYRYCEEFSSQLEAVSGGKLTCVWNPASTLGNTTQHYAMLKEGTLDIFSTAFDTASSLQDGEDFNALVVPYIFEDTAHFEKFLDSDLLQDMLAKVEPANNVKYLGNICTNWPRALTTTKSAVSTPDDLKGMKIRISESVSANAVWTAWGANPVKISASELYGALENGQADGQDNNIISVWNNSYYEVTPFITELNYIQQANILWMSGSTYEKLNDTQKAWIEEAMAAAWDINTASVVEEHDECAKNLEEAGCTFVEFDKDAFVAAAETVARQLESDGVFAEGLYDEIRALA